MQPPVLMIPAYNPDEELFKLIAAHQAKCPEQKCIIINDGSKPECDDIFKQLTTKNTTVLHHTVNAGKGAALKTGMQYFLTHFEDDCPGVVTADADGQHAISDIINLSRIMENHPSHLHLGVRAINDRHVPLRSRLGNTLTRLLFNQFTKNQIKDTQSGLRGIPTALIKSLINSKASRYEFEFEMFFIAKKLAIPILQTPIQTIYINDNKGSHFNPVFDSLKIYYVFLRFCSVAFLSFSVDFTLFFSVFYATQDMGKAMLMARLISATFNFFMNKSITFKAKNNSFLAALKFAALACCIGLSSYKLLQFFSYLGLNIYCSKIVAEFLLFIISFFMQNAIIFSKRKFFRNSLKTTSD